MTDSSAVPATTDRIVELLHKHSDITFIDIGETDAETEVRCICSTLVCMASEDWDDAHRAHVASLLAGLVADAQTGAKMSEAQEACWKWQTENRELMWELEGRDRDEALFAAGFAAGGVAALEQAANDSEFEFRSMTFYCRGENRGTSETTVHRVGGWLRDRAAQLRETP